MSIQVTKNKINSLTNAQAISIARIIKDSIQSDKLPKDYSLDDIDPVEAIYALYNETGQNVDKNEIKEKIDNIDQNAVGEAAKEFLTFVAENGDKELVEELDQELENPPVDEGTAVVDPGSLLIIVFGGIALLNVTASIRIVDGKVSYDTIRAKEIIKENIDGVVKILKTIFSPFSKKNKNVN